MIRVIDHVNIATENLEKTRDFFVDALGLEDGPRPDFGVPGHWLYADGRAIVHLQLAKGPVKPSRESALGGTAPSSTPSVPSVPVRNFATSVPFSGSRCSNE